MTLPPASAHAWYASLSYTAVTPVSPTTGALKCWGGNANGELAIAPDAGASFPSPVDISGVTNVVQVAVGHQTTCALILGGSVVCWGSNTQNELGRTPDSGVANHVPAPVAF